MGTRVNLKRKPFTVPFRWFDSILRGGIPVKGGTNLLNYPGPSFLPGRYFFISLFFARSREAKRLTSSVMIAGLGSLFSVDFKTVPFSFRLAPVPLIIGKSFEYQRRFSRACRFGRDIDVIHHINIPVDLKSFQ